MSPLQAAHCAKRYNYYTNPLATIAELNFTAYKHSIIKVKSSITEKLFRVGIIIIVIALIIYLIDNQFLYNQLSKITYILFLIGFLPIFISYIYQFFDYEIIDTSNKGYLEFNENEIIIDHNLKIKYEDIKEFEIGIISYYNQKINLTYELPSEKRSLGVSNRIKIVTDSKNLNLNFKLENENHLNDLEKMILNIVINDKLIKLDGKKTIKLIPIKFKELDSYKNYVIKQIVTKRINCTEGLLLHGYKSDKEAKLLRERYCG